MTETMTDTERQEFLRGLGLNPDKAALSAPAKVAHQPVPTHQPDTTMPQLAPPGVDPRTMPVDEIVFDPALLDRFPSLEKDGLKAASDYVFALYKSYIKGDPRNSVLHRKITSFISHTRRQRKSGGIVTEQVKATTEQRDMAAVLASSGMTTEALVALIQQSQQQNNEEA